MEITEIEAVVGRLYLTVVDLQKQNMQFKAILDGIADADEAVVSGDGPASQEGGGA